MKVYAREAHLTWEEVTEVKEAIKNISYRGVKEDRETLDTHYGLVLLGYANKEKDHYKVFAVDRYNPHKAIVKFDSGYILVGNLDIPFYDCGLKVINPADCIRGEEITKALGL